MGVEFEVKFRATREQLEAIRNGEPGAERWYAMATTYYDTPRGDLAERFFTLRRRRENDRSVCTLKTPEQGLGRREFELDCDNIKEALPELCKLSGMPELEELADKLVSVCGADFNRIAKTVELSDCTVELALDLGILTGGGKEEYLCEVEAELKDGSREAMLDYARYLAKTYGLVQEKNSKFRRAQLLAKGE